MRKVGTYTINVLIGVDVLACAVLGGPRYMTISGVIGRSIRLAGWASKVPWPKWWIRHCLGSDRMVRV